MSLLQAVARLAGGVAIATMMAVPAMADEKRVAPTPDAGEKAFPDSFFNKDRQGEVRKVEPRQRAFPDSVFEKGEKPRIEERAPKEKGYPDSVFDE